MKLHTFYRRRRAGRLAFTRAELAAIVAVSVLLALIVLPALANNRPRSDRVICANNLRQIGVAMHVWGDAYGERPPWEVPIAEGGTMRHPLAANAWLHFSWISNELATPRILFCPSDLGRAARDFTGDPGGGYVHPNFANRATSYFLAHSTHSSEWSADVQSGDRNITVQGTTTSCPRFTGAMDIMFPAGPALRWTPGLHDPMGNVLAFDGTVLQTDAQGFRNKLNSTWQADNGTTHVVLPR